MVRDRYRVGPQHVVAVSYPGGLLPAYRFGRPDMDSMVVFGGFDSYLQEYLPVMLALAHGGYHVIGFERPGQGAALEDDGLRLTPAWHRPVGATLDHFAVDRVTLVGISLGGGLAIRAAAREPRVARVIADDVLTDFLAANLRQVPLAARAAVRALLATRAGRPLDAVVRRRMRHALLTGWGTTQGMHVLGAATLRNHCQVGNIALSVQVMLDWLAGLDKRDQAAPPNRDRPGPPRRGCSARPASSWPESACSSSSSGRRCSPRTSVSWTGPAARSTSPVPRLRPRLRRVFTVLGGHAVAAGGLTLFVTATGVRQGHPAAAAALALAGAASIERMAAVNVVARHGLGPASWPGPA